MVRRRDESETDIDSQQTMLLYRHRATNFRMTGCKISGEQWVPRVPRKCDQKTEISQSGGYISLIEEKMIYKTVHWVFPPT